MKKVTIFALCGLFHTACSTAEKVKPAASESSLDWGNIIIGILVLGFFYVCYLFIPIVIAIVKKKNDLSTDSTSEAAAEIAGARSTSSASALDKTKAIEEKYSILKKLDLPIKAVGILATFLLFYGVSTGKWVLFKGVGGFGPAISEMATGHRNPTGTIKRNAKYILDSTRLANNNAAWAMREQNRHEEKMAKEARRMKQVEKMGSSSNKPWYTTSYDDTKKKRPVTDNYGEMEANANDNLRTGSNSSRRNIIPSRLAK